MHRQAFGVEDLVAGYGASGDFIGSDSFGFYAEVIIVDLKMPGVDGLEVLRTVKETRPEIEVIILTGHGHEEDRQLCMELGAFANEEIYERVKQQVAASGADVAVATA